MDLNLSYLFDSLYLIKPEIVISITLVLVVTADLFFSNDTPIKKKNLLAYISLAGTVAAAYFVIEQLDITAFAFAVGSSKGMMVIDAFGAFFKLLILLSTFLVIYFSIRSREIAEGSDRLGEYYTLLLGMVIGMMFLVSSSDLILIYVSLELVSLSSYVLAGFTKHSLRNSEASLKYVIYGGVSSGIMLFGISILYGLTGSTNLYEINSLIQPASINNLALLLSGLLIFTGIGFKISAAPFHFWTPDVYEGSPLPFTAFLSVASKAAGFALLIRFIKITFIQTVDTIGNWHLLTLIDWQTFLILLSILTMTLGNFAALWQSNMKRLLAYSSIAHAGYILLGLVVMTNQGLIAILIYFAIYALMNLGAFFVVILIENRIQSEELDDYKGLGYTSPVLAASLAIFMISLIGLPPTAGFIAKLYIFIALIDVDMVLVALIALLNTVVSLYYYVKVLKNMYLVRPETEPPAISVSPIDMALLVILLLPVLIFGVYFTPLVNFAKNSITLLGF